MHLLTQENINRYQIFYSCLVYLITYYQDPFTLMLPHVKPSGYQAIYCDAGYQGGWLPPPGFRVRFKILYRVIQPLIQHCLWHKMVYLNIIYVIATRNYEFFKYTQNLIGNITLLSVIISVASVN